jgi:hypothetical protein
MTTFSRTHLENLRRAAKERGVQQRGPNNPNWKGGVSHAGDGRVLVYCPGDPEATVCDGIYAFRYRLVARKMLGRALRPIEVVHHINGDCSDDRPENLMVFPSQREHARFELSLRGRSATTGQLL